jgi:hypothetical protein
MEVLYRCPMFLNGRKGQKVERGFDGNAVFGAPATCFHCGSKNSCNFSSITMEIFYLYTVYLGSRVSWQYSV